ncbi:major facilitator superfamily protein [Pochonia chlamydosporia 170]|uniref:Major facilitator superfamily protein n=1 Tax=Pochonia chlamydosporia 170 TaxID=1380566 RepID=A0A179FJ24_METCM|nr:major facilitator superfamily protein [Pochonia chlamydosporia 170]OAQ65542.2 major facilitator superfamily protein [Pochonia chlamydosporia 170]
MREPPCMLNFTAHQGYNSQNITRCEINIKRYGGISKSLYKCTKCEWQLYVKYVVYDSGLPSNQTGKRVPKVNTISSSAVQNQLENGTEKPLAANNDLEQNPTSVISNGVKLTPDEHVELVPQPSESPDDPLKWPSAKKNLILGVVIACSFLPDYGSVTGAATLAAQAEEYGITPDVVNHSQSGNQFMVGDGGVVAVMLSAYFGRLLVLFWFMLAAFVTSIADVATRGFMGFFVPRVMNGFFAGAAQGGGLMFIKDLLFFHRQASKTNLWQSCVILSPFLGPLLASFMSISLSWRWPFWIYSILTGVALIGVILFGEETYYNRDIPTDMQPVRQPRWLRLVGVEQWHSRKYRNSFSEAVMRSFKVLTRPVVLLANFYYVCVFAWLVAINATLPIFLTSLYGFGPKQIVFMFFAPIVAAVLAYTIGHWLHDMLARFHMRRNEGQFAPESRLLITWLAIPLCLQAWSSKRKEHSIRRLPSLGSRANSTTSTASTKQFHFVHEGENGPPGEDSGSIVVRNAIMRPVDMLPRPDARRPTPTKAGPRSDATGATTVLEPVHPSTSSPTDVVLFRTGVAPEYVPQPRAQDIVTPRIVDVDREEATIDLKNINWEHHGPGSWLSICSEPGIRWVSVKTKSSGFGDVARGLTADWTKHLSLSQCPIQKAGPEPDFDEAWQYATGASHIFGVVYRPQFEHHLRRHYQGLDTQDDDAASYAMRNAVYAVGCRASAARDGTKDFMEIRKQSLQFFLNALSVYTNLIFMPTGLGAVRALMAMTSYAELLGSPAVEYMLCAAAVRLAQSRGLHRQPSKAWNLPDDEVLHRNWTFWALYCYDKYLAMRCGRPSMLDDEDISCEIPISIPAGSTLDISICTAYIRHAQICSQMMKRLLSPQSLNQSADDLLREIEEFETKLTERRLCLPDHLSLDADALLHLTGPHRVKANMSTEYSLLHRAYHGSVIALHANFHYPWISSGILNVDVNNNALRDPVMQNSSRVAEAARQILASLKHWAPDIGSPQPQPMLAIINLFIYILNHPAQATTTSDLSFLDIGSGHFGHIHQLTSSQVSFRFPREAVALAGRAMKRASAQMHVPTRETTHANSPADTCTAIPEDPFLGMDISPEAWTALSADFFENFNAAGDMIVL